MNNSNNENIDLDRLTPEIRYLNDLHEVIFDAEWMNEQTTNPELYYMYRGLKNNGNFRYDITVIPPFSIGKEFVKTLGHFHSAESNEMYIVLEGEGLFIFQKGKDSVEDFYAIKGKPNDCIVVPKGYAHITINASPNQTLKMANWVKEDSGFDYVTVKNKKGLCYYFTTEGWIKNNAYQNIPEIRFEQPLEACPNNLDFLR